MVRPYLTRLLKMRLFTFCSSTQTETGVLPEL